jgi:hypothetical protein
MKMIRNTAIAALAFASLAAPAFADDTVKTVTKSEHKHTKKGHSSKTKTTTTHDPGGLMNSTTVTSSDSKDVKANNMGGTTTTTEKVDKTDAPGMKNDSKMKTKVETKTDANGNVVDTKVTH